MKITPVINESELLYTVIETNDKGGSIEELNKTINNNTTEQNESQVWYDYSDTKQMLTIRITNIPSNLVEEHYDLMWKLKAKDTNAKLPQLLLRNAIIQAYKDSIEVLKQDIAAVNNQN